jgi:alkylated DNA repair dioxygenase AlkB
MEFGTVLGHISVRNCAVVDQSHQASKNCTDVTSHKSIREETVTMSHKQVSVERKVCLHSKLPKNNNNKDIFRTRPN